MRADMVAARGPGRPQDLAKRDAILQAGWALFLERGVGAVSIDAIAARAGVSKMTVYKHFDDKHALFEQAVSHEMHVIERAQSTVSEDRIDDIESRLRAFGVGIMSYLATGAAIDFYNVLAGELRRHPDVARTFYEVGPAQTISNLAAILRDAEAELAIDDPVRAAEALFGLWQGVSNFQLSLGVGTADAEAAITRRVDYGIGVFMRAFGRAKP